MTRARALLPAVATAVLVSLTSAAQAQGVSSGLVLYGGTGGSPVSVVTIPAHPQGQVVVTFHGDTRAGCATYGLCPYSGTIVVRPRAGVFLLARYRRHGRIETRTSLLLDGGSAPYLTAARVERSTPGQAPGACADTEANPLGELETVKHGGAVTIGLFIQNGTLLSTRCAGPLDGDLAGAGPTVTIALKRLARGHTTVNLSGTRAFSAHGFAGEISSTLVVSLGKPSKQTNTAAPSFPPGIKTTRMRVVTEQLGLSRLTGALSATIQGSPNPVVCQLLDSCGLVGTLDFGDGVRALTAEVTALGPASRPDQDFLAALGLSSAGNPRGISVALSGSWRASPLTAEMTQFGSCTDSVPAATVNFNLTPRGAELRGPASSGSTATRCPGPELGGQDPLLTGSLPRRALRRRKFAITLRAAGVIQDDGYTAVPHGELSLMLSRGRVSQTVFLAPAG